MIPQLHLLNWGMGVESTAILVRWMLEPQSRPFNDFHNLIVLAAQTGDEMDETKYLCETYLFPLMRKHKVRLVQVAKASASKVDGYIILSDTHQPYELHTEGYFPLSRDLSSLERCLAWGDLISALNVGCDSLTRNALQQGWVAWFKRTLIT